MDSREKKLEEAKRILTTLGLPSGQCNDRSGWVLLALANIRPEDSWDSVQAPLLQTYRIMEFIRNHYGKNYKPNSRETIRRQTLHQFEQARIVDRNRDDPERPTNSKDNNYSLNESLLQILKQYPDGNWLAKIQQYKEQHVDLTKEYQRILNRTKIPVMLPNGEAIHLSPGPHNQLHADIVHEFLPRFAGKQGIVLYIGDTASSRNEGGKLMIHEEDHLESLGVPTFSHDKLPDIVAYDSVREWLFLIEAVTSHGPVSPKRWNELEAILTNCRVGKIYVSAFPNQKVFRRYAADIAWETEVWIADNPDHLVHFNGDRFLGPR